MSQYTGTITPAAPYSGATQAADFGALVAHVLSQGVGSSRPTNLTAGGLWAKDLGAGSYQFYLYDGTTDILLPSLDDLINATAKTTPVDADTLPLNDSADSGALKTLPIANLKAAIVSTGTNANGTYTKFADGTMICRGGSSGALSASNTSGAMYYSNQSNMTFPAAFSAAPTVILSTTHGANDAFAGAVNSLTTSGFSAAIWSAQASSSAAIQYVAQGKWF